MTGQGKPRKAVKIDRKTGKIVGEYDSLVKAAISVSGAVTAINAACKGRIKTAYGYVWHYAD